MRALVVYESMFGNTRDIAIAIADGIGEHLPADVVEVGEAPSMIPDDVALLVVGGPTHAHGMTKPDSRANAAAKAGDRLVSHGRGIREWLDGLHQPWPTVAAAAFDTRIKGPGILWGSAAKSAAGRLGDLEFDMIAPAESFLVGGPAGSMFDRLEDGEIDRARAWGARLAGMIQLPAGVR